MTFLSVYFVSSPIGEYLSVIKTTDGKFYMTYPGHSFDMFCLISEDFFNAFKKEFEGDTFIEISECFQNYN